MTVTILCDVCGMQSPNHTPGCSKSLTGHLWGTTVVGSFAPCSECCNIYGHMAGCSKAPTGMAMPFVPVYPAPVAPSPQWLPGALGWQCPQCRACWSPSILQCAYCGPKSFTTSSTVTEAPPAVGSGG